jgi:hypothetical protein
MASRHYRHKIPGYIRTALLHRLDADLACAEDAIETTDVVENHDRTTILRNYRSQ